MIRMFQAGGYNWVMQYLKFEMLKTRNLKDFDTDNKTR